MSRPTVGVILSGCGVMDGSEIHEAVITLLELARLDAEAVCLAPNRPQSDVVDHLLSQPSSESRNVLTEAARIARGEIRDLSEIEAGALDAIILPGGFGAAKNLCSFATDGIECEIDSEARRLLLAMHAAGKPIGAICIAPALLARVFGSEGIRVELTIGNDPETASKIEAMGATHLSRKVEEIAVDETNRIVSTPAYMLGPGIGEVAAGIGALVRKVVSMAG